MEANRNRWLEIILTAFIGALLAQFFALGLAGLNLLVVIVTIILIVMVLFEYALSPRLRQQARVQSLLDYLEELKDESTRIEQALRELHLLISQEIVSSRSTYPNEEHVYAILRIKSDSVIFISQSIHETLNEILKSQQRTKKLKRELSNFDKTSINSEELSKLEKEASKMAEVLDSMDDTLVEIKIQVNTYRSEQLGMGTPGVPPIEVKIPNQQSPSRLEATDEKPDKSDDDDKGDEDKPAKRTSKK